MTVRVLTRTAAEIFEGKLIASVDGKGIVGQLSIPEYQRPYCWKAQQIEQLLTDIRAQNRQLSDLPYYLGSLILHQENGKLNIIDGQQRVTTLVLIASLLQQGQNLPLVNSLEYEHPIDRKSVV